MHIDNLGHKDSEGRWAELNRSWEHAESGQIDLHSHGVHSSGNTHTQRTCMGVAAHHGHACDKVLESVNDGGNTQIQVKLTFTLRANMWLDAHATHVVIAVHHIYVTK